VSRVPRQTSIIRGLRDQAQSLRNSELVLADKLSARVALAEKATVDAEAAAAAAAASAAMANASAANASAQAASAVGAANNANAAAGNAQAAANTANARAGVLELTDVFVANPTSSGPVAGASWGTMPQMEMAVDSGGYPLIVFFSCELLVQGGNVSYNVILSIDGAQVAETHRRGFLNSGDSASAAFVHALQPAPGTKTIRIEWYNPGAVLSSPYTRRQFSVLRIGTP